MTGWIESAQLCQHLTEGIRVVDVQLLDAEIALPDGERATLISDIPIGDQTSFNLDWLHDAVTKDAITGVSTKSLHVRIPIQAAQRKRLATLQGLDWS